MSPAAARRRRADTGARPPARRLLRERAGRPYRVDFDVRTAYDFLISMIWHGSDYDRLPEDERWLAAARAALGEDERADIEAVFGKSGLGYGLLGRVLFRPEVRDAADLVALVDRLPARDYARALLDDPALEPDVIDLVLRALDGDRASLKMLPRRLPDEIALSAMSFLRDPEAAMGRLRRGLHAWLPHFQEVEARVLAILERDVELRAADRTALAPGDLIEKVTGGLRLVPDPRVDRIVLAPSYFGRPFNELESGRGWRLFCYPVADESLPTADHLAPPAQMLRLFRALGDASRLRILRLLVAKDLYLTEIAVALELSKPTVKHHLAQLRAAGLVTVVEEANLTYYSLRRERLDDASAELRSYLG